MCVHQGTPGVHRLYHIRESVWGLRGDDLEVFSKCGYLLTVWDRCRDSVLTLNAHCDDPVMFGSSGKEHVGWRRRFCSPGEGPMGRGGAFWRIVSHFSRGEIDSSSPMTITGKQWFRVVVLCLAVAVINSMDRMAMSIAVLPMSKQYHWSDTDKGTVSRLVHVA